MIKKIICFLFGHRIRLWESPLAITEQCLRCNKILKQELKYVGALGDATQNSREKYYSEIFSLN